MEEEFVGKLQKIDPKRIIDPKKSNELDDFFLTLALIFNDLKGIVLFERMMIERFRKPEVKECSVQCGEYGGLLVETSKFFGGVINEFFIFLSKNKDIVNSWSFGEILKAINKSERELWEEIINTVFNKIEGASDFSKTLKMIRNHVAFHYYGSHENLRDGFINFFFKKEKIQHNEFAYYSMGEPMTMENTRFYYIDAAEQEYLNSLSNDYELFKNNVSKMILKMNFTIAALIKEYIRTRPHKN